MTRLNRRLVKGIAFWLLLLIAIPIFYLIFLETFVSHPGMNLSPKWMDDTFNLRYENPVWFDHTFDKGWTIAWTHDQSDNSSGFNVFNYTLALCANFQRFDSNNSESVKGIIVQKSIVVLDTAFSPFLVIRHRESSSDSALMFSFGVIDVNGVYHNGEMYHVSSSTSYLEVDLREVYVGKICGLSLRFTNDFDPSFSGGLRMAYVEDVTIFEKPLNWYSARSGFISGNVSSYAGILNISIQGYRSTGDIMAAQRIRMLPSNLTLSNYLKVLIMTSSINISARIVIWPDAQTRHDILLKTYNDREWHIEIINLGDLGLRDNIHMIELSLMQLYPSNSSDWILYKELSFNTLEV